MGFATLSNNWRVNGTPIYAPSEKNVQIDHDNIVTEDSGRTESGYMHIRWVRRDVIKVNLTYDKLTGNEKDLLLNLMQGKEFQFTYWDNGPKTINGYVGKTTYQLDSSKRHEDEGGVFRNVQINVVQM